MKVILHGTWVHGIDAQPGGPFFVWAEQESSPRPIAVARQRVARHPFGAAAIEITSYLALLGVPWAEQRSQRLTRLVMLPTRTIPIVPSWLVARDMDARSKDQDIPDDATTGQAETVQLRPWRVEGLGLDLLHALDLLVTLPRGAGGSSRRDSDCVIGSDLRYWGIVAKFLLELLARERFLPGLRDDDDRMRAVWEPILDEDQDRERLEALARAMPPACRAVLRQVDMGARQAVQPMVLLEDFVDRAVDQTVRAWAQHSLGPTPRLRTPQSVLRRRWAQGETNHDISQQWWQALASDTGELARPQGQQGEQHSWIDLYRSWQDWRFQSQSHQAAPFRVCFRLEPPQLSQSDPSQSAGHWVLRYFLQDADDPSLLVPAREVWRERGNTLSYLNRHFDNPQGRLQEALEMAGRLCPAIRRSLALGAPEATYLSDQEAFTFLRETARLLEGTGFAVLVPPWWNKPDTRLRVRARLHGPEIPPGTSNLSMDALISYDWRLALGDEILSREEFERLAALKTPLVQLRGRWVMLQPDQIEAAIAFWERQRAGDQVRLSEALGLALGAESQLGGLPISQIDMDEQFAALMASLRESDNGGELTAPTGFVGQLRPYQVRGYRWMAELTHLGFGVCLADDMGLGKTIQAIALFLHDHQQNGRRPSLVVCPTSLVGNWAREVARFAPCLTIKIHHGNRRSEGEAFVRESTAVDLVISTYGLVRRDLADLRRVRWHHIIIDEAQNIKNPSTKQSRAIRRLQGDYKAALTGTPIENRLSELWSIMAFLNPGYLGSLESFRRRFSLPIERYQDDEASDRLRKLVRPFVMRRLKTDPHIIQDLPDKFEYKGYCNLTREQATLYEAIVRDAMTRLRATDNDAEISIKRRGAVLAMLVRLKQVCNHPALFLGDGSALGTRSGKLNRLAEMLDEVLTVGDRALVFTQFAQMGKLLQRYLQRTFSEEILFLYGGTPQKQRDRLLTRFQDDPRAPHVFVLSLKAGGTGLNLMRANHVFHFDRWWNPAVENQATDRAYRIGQTRDVQVHKFICLGTLEERIDDLIESKRSLAENIIGPGESWVTEMNTEELEDLIALRAEALSE